MNGLQQIREFLEGRGVSYVFGLPGTQNAELFSEMGGSSIDIVTCSHEMSAGFAALGHAVAVGAPAVLLTIGGPGFAYTAAPMLEALHDSIPVLQIVVRNRPRDDRHFQLQDIDHLGIAERVSKAAKEVDHPEELSDALEWAWAAATDGEPGPVLLIVDAKSLGKRQDGGTGKPRRSVHSGIESRVPRKLLERLSAGKTILYVGRGAARCKAIRELAEKMTWPVATTVSGRGAIPESHDLALRFDQRPTDLANQIIDQCDNFLAIGAKFSHAGSLGYQLRIPSEKLIHIDLCEGNLGANYSASYNQAADSQTFIADLVTGLERTDTPDSSWFKGIQGKLQRPGLADELEPKFIGSPDESAKHFVATVQQVMPEDSMFVTDSGFHQMLLRRHFVAAFPTQLVVPTDFQSMGFGLPAAIGAALSNTERDVVVVHGDGGFRMTAMDLATAVQLRLRLRVFVFDDGHFGLIRSQQLDSGDAATATELPMVDLQRFASSIGADYFDASSGLREVLRQASQIDGPVVIRQQLIQSDAQERKWRKSAFRGKIRRALGDVVLEQYRKLRGRGQ